MRHRFVILMAVGMIATACGGGGSTTVSPPGDVPEESHAVEAVALAPTDGIVRSDPVASAPVRELVAGFNDAGFELWRGQPPGSNLVFSPASVGHALLMARAAADETTGSAIDAAFDLPAGLAAHQAWNATDQSIAASAATSDEMTVRIADRVWPDISAAPAQEWIDLLAAEHGATTEALDFIGEPETGRRIINAWVGDQTEGLIPELLPAGSITPRTVLVLTDAVYFKAPWQTAFAKYENVAGTFTRLDGSTIDVEYMRELELPDRRGRGDGFVGAEIPYVGGDFSMLVIVPDEGRYADVRNRIDQRLLDEIDAGFTTGPYELLLPEWATTSHLDLLSWLGGIGAAPGLYPAIAPNARLDGAMHGADITVDEWGTVAAAATGLTFAASGPPEPELTVRADRPFLYLIRHRPTGLIVFAGQVTDPTD